MSKHANTELSKVVNDTMDCIGYSQRNICSRAAFYKSTAKKYNTVIRQLNLENNLDLRFEVILAGSRGEGVVQLQESDIDIMFVCRNILCVDSGSNENDLTVIRTHMAESPPGYTKLIPLNMNAEMFGSGVLALSTVYDLTEGHILLLSSCARNFYEGSLRIFETAFGGFQWDIKQNSGPAVPVSMKPKFGGIFSQLNIQTITQESDLVIAMPYLSSTILETWKGRTGHDWPRHEVIQDVSTMEGFVVPVGPKFSEEQNFEWRICYTTAEQKLVASFNPVQYKLYALMKMIFKQIINPECDLITSYMVKNIVFWICEKIDGDCATDDKLIDLLLYSLQFLLNCLHGNFLPNYMIPSRNLLLGKGNPHDKVNLRRILRDILKEGGAVVFRLRKVGTVTSIIMRNPVIGKSYAELRDKVENTYMSLFKVDHLKLSPALLFSHDCIYNVAFEMLKDPMYLERMCSLMGLLKMDLLQFVTDPSSSFQEFQNILMGFLS